MIILNNLSYPGALAEIVYVPGSNNLQYSPLFVVFTVWFMPKICILAPGIGLLFSSWTNPVKAYTNYRKLWFIMYGILPI